MKSFNFASTLIACSVIYSSSLFSQTVIGSGTANKLPKFTAASTIGNSQITDNGTTVSLGSASVAIGAPSVTSGDFVTIVKNQNAKTRMAIRNLINGVAVSADFSVISSYSSLSMNALSGGYTPSGIFESSTAVLSATGVGGMNIGTTPDAQLSLWTNNIKRMTITNTGSVGIGTTSPLAMFEVVGKAKAVGLESTVNQATDYGFNELLTVNRNLTKAFAVFNNTDVINTEKLIIWGTGRTDIRATTKTDKYFVVNDLSVPTAPIEAFSVSGNGYTQINVSSLPSAMDNVIDVVNVSVTPNLQLFRVKSDGKVYAREVQIMATSLSFPDYVFNKEYKLLPLSEVETYIKSNKHLPGFEKGSYYEENGIKSSEMFVKQQEKIEELTLYIIELEKRMKAIEAAQIKK